MIFGLLLRRLKKFSTRRPAARNSIKKMKCDSSREGKEICGEPWKIIEFWTQTKHKKGIDFSAFVGAKNIWNIITLLFNYTAFFSSSGKVLARLGDFFTNGIWFRNKTRSYEAFSYNKYKFPFFCTQFFIIWCSPISLDDDGYMRNNFFWDFLPFQHNTNAWVDVKYLHHHDQALLFLTLHALIISWQCPRSVLTPTLPRGESSI